MPIVDAALRMWDILFDFRGENDGENINDGRSEGTACIPEHPTQASQLLGAAEALREEMGAPVPPCAQEEHAAALSVARMALGDEAFAAVFEAGSTMTVAEIMALAMEVLL